MLKPRAAVHNVKAYHPPLGDRQGLRMDFNENTVGCSPRVLQCLQKISGEQLARYPERSTGRSEGGRSLRCPAPRTTG